MPRLNHRKARTGCTRCKARKVKCDEARPRCSACARHDVSCEYAPANNNSSIRRTATPNKHEDSPSIDYTSPPLSILQDVGNNDDKCLKLGHNLEMRLMHNWTANTCKTLWITWQYWHFQAPLIALEWRYVMEALLAISARHSSRQAPTQWVSLQGRMVPIRDPVYTTFGALPDPDNSWNIGQEKLDEMNRAIVNKGIGEREARLKAHGERCQEMLGFARIYFDRALEGHMTALKNLTADNIESVYVTSILICVNALAMLGDDEYVDPLLWFRTGFGIRGICKKWEELVGHEWMAKSGVFYGKPDLMNQAELFDPKHSEVFRQLLTHGSEFENIPEEDATAYLRTVSYIGLVYKIINNKEEEELCTFRRFMGMPSVSSPRFFELLEQKQPRALVILAHVFALMKLLSGTVWIVRGLAERQIPRVVEQLPSGWRPVMAWPMEVMQLDVGEGPKDGDVHDILSF